MSLLFLSVQVDYTIYVIKKELGMYALDGYQNHDYTEILAESFAGRFEHKYAQELLKRLEEQIL